ncbi:signal peptidase II [Kribbella deserti]|uniref:Lipoprotein signal peptidase n=1 Tax=Kribbella deserti TaxID=1926257 RepID=A0ABV6QL21_9ACTN
MQRTRRTPLSQTPVASSGDTPDRDPGAQPENAEPADTSSAGSASLTEPSSTEPPLTEASAGESSAESGPGQDEPAGSVPGQRSSLRLPLLFGLLGLLVIGLDQLTKVLALRNLEPGEPVDLVGSLLRLNLIRNPGAAFSLGSDYTPVIAVIQISVAIAVVYLARRLGSTGWTLAFGFLFGGAVGNIIDRIFREPSPFHGHVVDFLQLPHWAIFNVADMAVTTAAILMVVQTLRGIRLDGTREVKATHE